MIDRNPIVFLFGIISLVGSIFSFSIVHNLGYSHLFELRMLNVVFLLIGIVSALNFSLRSRSADRSSYRKALMTGIQISIFTASLFAAYLYMASNVDESLNQMIAERTGALLGMGPIGLSLSTFLEALFSGVIITIVYLQFQKGSFIRRKVLHLLRSRA